jgi:hypothetical protein
MVTTLGLSYVGCCVLDEHAGDIGNYMNVVFCIDLECFVLLVNLCCFDHAGHDDDRP